jgi:hypothetical protein
MSATHICDSHNVEQKKQSIFQNIVNGQWSSLEQPIFLKNVPKHGDVIVVEIPKEVAVENPRKLALKITTYITKLEFVVTSPTCSLDIYTKQVCYKYDHLLIPLS